MGWYGLIPQYVGQGVTVMDQRVRFIAEYLNGYRHDRPSLNAVIPKHGEKCNLCTWNKV
jgi:hypothetical protein